MCGRHLSRTAAPGATSQPFCDGVDVGNLGTLGLSMELAGVIRFPILRRRWVECRR